MKRTDQREWVFKLIFQDTINKIEDTKDLLSNHKLNEDETFIVESINSYKKNFEKIDKILQDNAPKGMPKLSRVVKSIIYLSINEIYFLDIPVSVSINEAVNIAKKFSNEDDYKIVNLILGNIVRNENK
ncbi:putative transcription antitermination factor NusB [Anaerococcus lactolyticus ATCC 51172]|uniref:Putative transcription antitermination factor NusB n=1 Tax=Anaerococcus lactolyticus ATCC 51172 TaxID=525254 RepID=C2BDP7_9FIRM|nr:transcription antitermination factor NusB [Anaerococcus lactolyticus]EEI86912.1 putative transcription antitermination factor NusB [Anaerococcus lactolyticus ATCC 51172]